MGPQDSWNDCGAHLYATAEPSLSSSLTSQPHQVHLTHLRASSSEAGFNQNIFPLTACFAKGKPSFLFCFCSFTFSEIMSSVWNHTLCNLFFFFLMPFWRYRLHTVKSTYSRCTIQGSLWYLQNCTTTATVYLRNISITPQSICPLQPPREVPTPAFLILAKFIGVAPTLWLVSLVSSLLLSP